MTVGLGAGMGVQQSYNFPQRGYAGMRAGDSEAMTLINDLGAVRQVDTLSFVVANTHTYTVTVNGVLCSYASGASATAAQIRDGMIDAIRNTLDLENVCFPQPSGNNVTLTAAIPGTGFTTAGNDGDTTITNTTANVAPTTIPFGAAIVKRTGTGTTDKSGGLPSAPAAQVSNVATTAGGHGDGLYQISITPFGADGPVNFEFTASSSSLAAVIAALIDAINNENIGITASDHSNSHTSIDLTADVAGHPFTVAQGSGHTGTALVLTTPTADTTAYPVGVAERIHSGVDVTSAALNPGYKQGEPMTVLFRGFVWVNVEEAVTAFSDPVYVRHTASGSLTPGNFRRSAAGGQAFLLKGARFVTSTTGAGLAVLQLGGILSQ